jgi:hypothetical protein
MSDMNDMSEHEVPGKATTPAFLLKRYAFEVKRLTFRVVPHSSLASANYSQL